MPAAVATKGDGLFVMTYKRATDHAAAIRLKTDAVANIELKHGHLRLRLTEQPKPLDDALVQCHKLGFV